MLIEACFLSIYKQIVFTVAKCYTHRILTSVYGKWKCFNHDVSCLEAEDLVLKFADRAGLGVSERLGSLLHGANHGRRTAHENLDIAGGGRETLLYIISTVALDRYAKQVGGLP